MSARGTVPLFTRSLSVITKIIMLAHSKLKAVFAGAGLAMMSEPSVISAVLSITEKPDSEVKLLYLGTATYDLAQFREKQTAAFCDRGVTVEALQVYAKQETGKKYLLNPSATALAKL